jgi:hypothetical protein
MARDFDALLKELVEEKYESIVCPPKEEIWRQLEIKLLQNEKERISKISYNHSKGITLFKKMSNYLSDKMKVFNFSFNRKSKSNNE